MREIVKAAILGSALLTLPVSAQAVEVLCNSRLWSFNIDTNGNSGICGPGGCVKLGEPIRQTKKSGETIAQYRDALGRTVIITTPGSLKLRIRVSGYPEEPGGCRTN